MAWQWIRTAFLVLLAQHGLAAHSADAVPMAGSPAQIVLGTPSTDRAFAGSYLRRIYAELARRTGVRIDVVTMPVARLTQELVNDKIDGDTARALAFAQAQPQLLRIDEPVMEVQLALWATDPKVRLGRLEDLATSDYAVTYTRGALICENILKPLVPAERLTDINGTVQAVEMMHYGRNALYCGIDITVVSEAQEALPQKPAPLRVLNLGKPMPLFLFLQPRYTTLVAPVQQALRRMRQDGTLERLRRDALKEFNIPANSF